MGGGLVESTLRAGADAAGLRLIETLAVGSPLRVQHRARMAAGAAALGWGFDGAAFDAALRGGTGRMRLTLGAAGDFALTCAPLPPAPVVWRIGLAKARLASGDPWLTVKSTRRGAYDAARAGLPEGLDEVILLNERGEVCDGTITTVFFDRGQGMRTPPLTCGLLPGVLRAEMACREEVLLARDLASVRLWVGNALRGLIPAVWTGGATW